MLDSKTLILYGNQDKFCPLRIEVTWWRLWLTSWGFGKSFWRRYVLLGPITISWERKD